MNAVLQVDEQAIAAEEILPLLARYQLLPHLLREIVIDQAIAAIECSETEIEQICQQLAQVAAPREAEVAAVRALKIEKLKQMKWGNQLASYFLERQDQLNQIIYSLIRTQDAGVANELYFRLQEQEQTFAELAPLYSQGTEAQTAGLVGPVELGQYHPSFARLLAASQPGQLMPPVQLENWFVIIRVEKHIRAQLDASTRQRLLDERFEQWLHHRISQLQQQDSATAA